MGGITWPQGTVADQQNIWVANCGNNSVTKIPNGDPGRRSTTPNRTIAAGSGVAFGRPFGDTIDAQGHVFVTGNGEQPVVKLSPNGEPLG